MLYCHVGHVQVRTSTRTYEYLLIWARTNLPYLVQVYRIPDVSRKIENRKALPSIIDPITFHWSTVGVLSSTGAVWNSRVRDNRNNGNNRNNRIYGSHGNHWRWEISGSHVDWTAENSWSTRPLAVGTESKKHPSKRGCAVNGNWSNWRDLSLGTWPNSIIYHKTVGMSE